MSIKIKYVLILLLISVSSLGFYFFDKTGHKQYPTFSTNIKHVGTPLTEDEQKLFNKIVSENKKFISKLSAEDKILFDNIEEKVKEEIKKNSNVKINYKNFCSKDEYKIVSTVRKYKKGMKANTDKKLFSSMIKKLDYQQIAELMLYIK
jgi:Ser-tRNA(Ala) deacylase AlaX